MRSAVAARGEGKMVRHIQTILTAICLVLFFFVALLLLIERPWISLPLVNYDVPLIVQMVVLLAAVAMILIVGALAMRQLRKEAYITKESDDGSVTIVESAITDYLEQVVADVDAVQSAWTKIGSTPKGLVVEVFTKVSLTETLPRIKQTIQERVREALEQTLGVGGVAAINVKFKGFGKAKPRVETAGEVGAVEPPDQEAAPERWSQLFPRSKTGDDVESEPGTQTPEQKTSERDD